MTLNDMPEAAKHAFDWASAVVAIATVAKWLPALAALLTILWTLLRIYDRLRHGPSPRD